MFSGLNSTQLWLIGGGLLIAAAFAFYRYVLPKMGTLGVIPAKPTRQQAFEYATGLEAYHNSVGCTDGAEFARSSGRALFDVHHQPSVPQVPQ